MTRNDRTIVVSLAVLLSAGACASHDFGNVEQLGAATDHNMQLQAIRDLDEPNLKGVEGGEGGRAGEPVRRLREGKAEELSPMSGT